MNAPAGTRRGTSLALSCVRDGGVPCVLIMHMMLVHPPSRAGTRDVDLDGELARIFRTERCAHMPIPEFIVETRKKIGTDLMLSLIHI